MKLTFVKLVSLVNIRAAASYSFLLSLSHFLPNFNLSPSQLVFMCKLLPSFLSPALAQVISGCLKHFVCVLPFLFFSQLLLPNSIFFSSFCFASLSLNVPSTVLPPTVFKFFRKDDWNLILEFLFFYSLFYSLPVNSSSPFSPLFYFPQFKLFAPEFTIHQSKKHPLLAQFGSKVAIRQLPQEEIPENIYKWSSVVDFYSFLFFILIRSSLSPFNFPFLQCKE